MRARNCRAFHDTHSVGKKRESAARADTRIKLAQPTSGGIARIDEFFFAFLPLLGVKLFKIRF